MLGVGVVIPAAGTVVAAGAHGGRGPARVSYTVRIVATVWAIVVGETLRALAMIAEIKPAAESVSLLSVSQTAEQSLSSHLLLYRVTVNHTTIGDACLMLARSNEHSTHTNAHTPSHRRPSRP